MFVLLLEKKTDHLRLIFLSFPVLGFPFPHFVFSLFASSIDFDTPQPQRQLRRSPHRTDGSKVAIFAKSYADPVIPRQRRIVSEEKNGEPDPEMGSLLIAQKGIGHNGERA